MGRIATSLTEQIQKLSERGMELDMPETKIKEILLDIGYYRLGFYWNPFELDSTHQFAEGVKFSDVVALYYLDVDLRNLLSKYLTRLEINFRTKLVYYASNKYKNSPTWFADPNVVNDDLIDRFKEIYSDKFKFNHKAIKLHHSKYINDKHAPAWKTLEYLTFGTIIRIFKSLKDDGIKERIAGCYNIRNLNKFTNLMETSLYLRNVCAHNDILFDLQTPKGISILPDITFNNGNRNSLDCCIKVVLRLLKEVSEVRQEELNNQIQALFNANKQNETIRKIIEEKIGYVFL